MQRSFCLGKQPMGSEMAFDFLNFFWQDFYILNSTKGINWEPRRWFHCKTMARFHFSTCLVSIMVKSTIDQERSARNTKKNKILKRRNAMLKFFRGPLFCDVRTLLGSIVWQPDPHCSVCVCCHVITPTALPIRYLAPVLVCLSLST